MGIIQLIEKAKTKLEDHKANRERLEKELAEVESKLAQWTHTLRFLEESRDEAQADTTDPVTDPRIPLAKIMPGSVVDSATQVLISRNEMPHDELLNGIQAKGHPDKDRRTITAQLMRHARKTGSRLLLRREGRKKIWRLA